MSKVSPIPEGFTSVTPHLVVKGAAEAIEFYKKAFGAEEVMRMPMPDGTIMHAEMKIGNALFMLAEEFPGHPVVAPTTKGGTTITMNLYVNDCDAAFKQAVAAGATTVMPVMDMFWGDRYGSVSDPYGHHWSIATHTKDMTPEEIGKAAAEWMAKMGDGPCSGEG